MCVCVCVCRAELARAARVAGGDTKLECLWAELVMPGHRDFLQQYSHYVRVDVRAPKVSSVLSIGPSPQSGPDEAFAQGARQSSGAQWFTLAKASFRSADSFHFAQTCSPGLTTSMPIIRRFPFRCRRRHAIRQLEHNPVLAAVRCFGHFFHGTTLEPIGDALLSSVGPCAARFLPCPADRCRSLLTGYLLRRRRRSSSLELSRPLYNLIPQRAMRRYRTIF